MTNLFACLAAAAILGFSPPSHAQTAAVQHGVSTERLTRLHDYLRSMTDARSGRYLGAVSLVLRDGVVIDSAAYGYLDMARTAPMPPDAIFRIYSMSKTVTATAILMLLEQGRLGLEDPVSRFIPEYSNMRVYTAGSVDAPVTRAASSPITIRHLLTHTAGFAVYGGAAGKLFDRAAVAQAADLADYVARLAKAPLAHDPGREFHYDGVPTQVAARIVEIASGMRFDDFLRTRLFEPLHMVDTGFEVPAAKRSRIAEMTTTQADGTLVAAPLEQGELPPPGERMRPFLSGAGGLYSTAPDYARFAQMLLDGGTLDGVRILGRKSVELMMSNHLGQLAMPVAGLNPGESFGLGGSLVVDAARRGRLGSNGQFGWSGAGGTWYTIDPRERLVAVLMTQHLPQGLPSDPRKPIVDYGNLVYQALVAPPRE